MKLYIAEKQEVTKVLKYVPSEDASVDDKRRVIDKAFIDGVADAIAGQRASVLSAATKEQESAMPLPHNLLSL